MNTNKLAKFYPALTAMERLRLIHDAGKRGDAREQQRLLDAAPRQHYSRADSGELEVRLIYSAAMHHAFQLGLAAEFWHAQTRVAWETADLADDDSIPDEALFWSHSTIVLETVFAVERDGWNLFLQQSGWDASRISVPPLAGHWMLVYMNEHATAKPPADVVDALTWLLSRDDNQRAERVEPLTLITPESVANGWHRAVEEQTAV